MKKISNIKKYVEFINERLEGDFSSPKKLIYYSFDIDDNLLYMPTKIHMLHLVNGEWIDEKVDTEMFARIRSDKDNWRYKDGMGGQESFVEFRDWGDEGDNTFLNQFIYAVKNKRFAPSWYQFIECLVNGNIFSIVTSRGHSSKNIKRAIEWLIYEYGLNKFRNLPIRNVDVHESFEDQMIQNLLLYHELFGSSPDDIIYQYLECCPVYTITSVEFINRFGNVTPENAKRLALNDFNNVVYDYAERLGIEAKYGFSDDDPKFVMSAVDQFRELKDLEKNKNIEYTVFDTGKKDIRKINI